MSEVAERDSDVRRTSRVSAAYLALGEWSELLAALRHSGFPVSPDREARLATLLWRLGEAGVSVDEWQQACDYMAPIFCVRADDHARFRALMRQHYARRAARTERAATSTPSAPPSPVKYDRLLLIGAIVGLAAIVVIAIIGWQFVPSGVFNTGEPGPVPPATPASPSSPDFWIVVADLLNRFLLAAPVLVILAAVLAWRDDRRAMLLRKTEMVGAEENFAITVDGSGLFRDPVSRNAFTVLKRALVEATDRIDVRKSMRATLAACGWPSIHYRRRTTNTELVLLVDRGGARDHIGFLADVLVRRFRASEAFVTRYDYRFHPGRVTLTDGRAEGAPDQDLSRVAQRHTSHRLILVTDGEGLFVRGTTGIDRALAREFAHFGRIIVVTPTPAEAWGERERALVAAGAIVVPATERGLDRAAALVGTSLEDATRTLGAEIPEGFDAFLEQLERDFHRLSSDTPPPPREVAELAMRLDVWAGPRENYRVLAAAAAFPWIDPGLTLAFGAAILERPVSPELYARLARLPWMRNARMPDWLRIAVVNRLSDIDRKMVAERMAMVLSKARSRPEGHPLSAEECAALPVAQEIDGSKFIATTNPDAFAGMQERVFLSFLNGDKLDPTNPLTPEATAEMKRGIGAEFVRKRRLLTIAATAVAVGLFVLKDPLSAALGWFERNIGERFFAFLPSDAASVYWRWPALGAMFAALGTWAWHAAREPETRATRPIFTYSLPLPASLAGLMWRPEVRLSFSHQTSWLVLALIGLMLAIVGLGDGAAGARVTLIAGALVVGWVVWVRLPLAGAATSLKLGYDTVQVCDADDRCTVKPGGLAAYPFGRTIRERRLLQPLAAVAGCALLAFIAMTAVIVAAAAIVTPKDNQAAIAGIAVAIVACSAMFALCRRVTIGVWALPDGSWNKSIWPVTDVFMAATTNVVLLAVTSNLTKTGGLKSFGDTTAVAIISACALVACMTLLYGAMCFIGLRVRTTWLSGNAKALLLGGGLGLGIESVVLATVGVSFTAVLALAIYPICLFAVSFAAMLRARRTEAVAPTAWPTIRRRALVAMTTGLFGVYAAPVGLGFVVAALSPGGGGFIPDSILYGFLAGSVGYASTYVVIIYPAWRYVGPAALEIEQLPPAARPTRPVPEAGGRSWWDTPWPALPPRRMNDPHPMRLLGRLGISDGPAAIAIAATICLQYVFLAKLWEGYPIRHMGDVIHGNVVLTMGALSLLGAITIGLFSLRHWSLGVAAARRLERPATHPSFGAIGAALATIASRSTLPSAPTLLYTPKNASALEVRERGITEKAVVVGLDQRGYQQREPAAFAAMLGHEVSHLEMAATRIEIGARRAVTLHFRIFGWLVAMFLLLLGFIDPRGIGSAPPLGGFVPVFDSGIYVGLGSQFAVLLLSSAIVFVYSYFFIVRREHIHDFRGSQLAATDSLAAVFAAQRPSGLLARMATGVSTFFALHPNPAARFRVLKRHDFILLSAVLYPAVVSGLEPLILLLTAGWRDVFGVSREMWNLGLTFTAGIFLFAVLWADLARLGLGLLLRPRRYFVLVPVYALVAGAATQIPRVILEILFGLRRGFPLSVIVERISSGSVVGAERIALMTAAILALLACLNAVRIAATGEANAGRWRVMDGVSSALIVTGGFTVASLSTPAFILAVLSVCVIVALAYALWFSVANRCSGCGWRRFSALRLCTRCACGTEQLPRLRRWTAEPFERQLMAG